MIVRTGQYLLGFGYRMRRCKYYWYLVLDSSLWVPSLSAAFVCAGSQLSAVKNNLFSHGSAYL